MTKTLFEVYKEACKKLSNPIRDEIAIRMLLVDNNHLSSMSSFFTSKDENIRDLTVFLKQFDRFLAGEPVAYILNYTYFLGQKFYVDNRVLIPRNETEEVVDFAIKKINDIFPNQDIKIADICTGSGVIGISLKQAFPHAQIILSDIDENALKVAEINQKNYNLSLKQYCGNALKPLIENNEKIDVIIANPPYVIDREIVDKTSLSFEPFKALYTDPTLPVYKDILIDAKKVQNKKQLIIFEIDPSIVDEIQNLTMILMPNAEYEIVKDINGFERIFSIINK